MTESDELIDKNIPKLQTLINQQESELISFNFLKKLLIDELHKLKGKKIFGIFCKFDTILTTKEGDITTSELSEKLANTLAEKGFVVIAGNFIYEMDGGKINREDTTIESLRDTIRTHSEKDYLFKISECLASSTSHALFILLNKDSASQHEAIIFHSEEKKHPSELAIALYFVEDLPQDRCKFIIEKKSKENTPYYICNSEDFNNQCLKIEKDCFFTKQVGLSASHIQLFINNTYSKLILLDQHSNITNIILELIE